MEVIHGFLPVEGGRLYFETAGSGPPVVLLHGFSLDARLWDFQFEALAAHYRVLRYDLRGFGRSDLPGEQPYAHYQDLKTLLEALDWQAAALVGLSLGGGVALDFVLAYPERVAALVLVDSTLGGFAWSSETRRRDGAVWAAGRQHGVEAARSLWLQHPLFATLPAHPQAMANFRQMVEAYSGWHWTHRDPVQGLLPAAAGRLNELQVPALVVVGELDLPDFQRTAAQIGAGLPGAQRVVLQGAGHLSNLEAPQAFNSLLLSFLDSV